MLRSPVPVPDLSAPGRDSDVRSGWLWPGVVRAGPDRQRNPSADRQRAAGDLHPQLDPSGCAADVEADAHSGVEGADERTSLHPDEFRAAPPDLGNCVGAGRRADLDVDPGGAVRRLRR